MRSLILLVVASFHLCIVAQKPPIRTLYVFGDSYSDTGRGWVNSNGPTAIAFLAQRLRLDFVPSNAADTAGKSLNFAVSGAGTGSNPGHWVTTAFISLGMHEQVAEFISMLQSGKTSFDPKTTVFFLEGGLNDKKLPTEQIVANLEDLIQKLYDAGGRRFKIGDLPESVEAYAETAKRLNPEVEKIPAVMKARNPKMSIELTHWGQDFDVVRAHAAQYGFTNTTDQCSGRAPFGEDATPCASPETHFFFHKNHPSAAVAKIVGDMMYTEWTGKK